MTEDAQSRPRTTKRIWLALAVVVALLAILLVPPYVSVSRYKSQITSLMADSLGRPVRLGSVELHLLPRPGLVLTDLVVDEDPAYGAEPILHADTVTASFRLLALWRGRLEISRVSVDAASLNLVRMPDGHWNLDSLFRTAAAKAGSAALSRQHPVPLPYLEATNSRINVKNGAEKLPFSLVSTDLSFWQQNPGDWRIRLSGQPARTDVNLDLADTGVVRLEASARRATQLREMPVHLDLEWREAQLGQLTRLVFGSDPGWRGDLTGELHLDGTPEEARVTTRLRATGVHRAEFAPAAPLDFDARCGFVYHYSLRALDSLACDSPLGDGRIRFAGDLPGDGARPHYSVALDHIPVQAGLDALRTVRSDLAPGLDAGGTISGTVNYAQAPAAEDPSQKATLRVAHIGGKGKGRPAVDPGPLSGSFLVEGFELRGGGLNEPIKIPKIVLEPSAAQSGPEQAGLSQHAALGAVVSLPAGGTGPLTITSRLGLAGYQVAVRGQASFARARELARMAGMANASLIDQLAGDPLTVDLSADGPWVPRVQDSLSAAAPSTADRLTGTVTLRDANWKADYLANYVQIGQATLHLDNALLRWDPIAFSYGPVKGNATLNLPASCPARQTCLPQFSVHFGDLDASALEAAVLGARVPGTLLSTLIARLHPSTSPAWPTLQGVITADSLRLGPVTLAKPTATLSILPNGAEITGLDAGLLGGTVHGGGTLHAAVTDGDKPSYTLTGKFEKLSPAAVGQLLGLRWSGGVFAADGSIDLAGFTDKDLAASVAGKLHFEWLHGAASGAGPAAPVLARFDHWTADADIANGAITLKQNEIVAGTHSHTVEGAITLGTPPKAAFTLPKPQQAKGR